MPRYDVNRVAQFSFIPSDESRDLASDIKALLEDIAGTAPREHRAYSGECHPSLDVLETDVAVEVIVDLSGVPADAVRVLFRDGVLIVAGEKAPTLATPQQTFHLVERDFGRFARVVRLTGAFDIPRAHAALRDGELTIVLPRLDDRRRQAHAIQVTGGNPSNA